MIPRIPRSQKKKKEEISLADGACCCPGLSRARSKAARETSTHLTFEIIPSWNPLED